jgi:hypothetical protein
MPIPKHSKYYRAMIELDETALDFLSTSDKAQPVTVISSDGFQMEGKLIYAESGDRWDYPETDPR